MLANLERLILDPLSEDSTNRPLEMGGDLRSDAGCGLYLVEHQYPRPERKTLYAGSLDSRGEVRTNEGLYSNRRIPIGIYVAEEQGLLSAVNKLTNPSFEVDTTDWTFGGAATLNASGRSLLWRKYGEASAYAKWTASSTQTAFFVSKAATGTTNYSASPSRSYLARVAINILSKGADDVQIVLRFFDSGGTNLGDQVAGSTSQLGEQILWGRATAPASSATVAILIGHRGSNQLENGEIFEAYIDGAGIYDENAAGGTLTPDYIDGDVPGCSWNGATPHAVASTRMAPNGDRFLKTLYSLEQKVEKLAREGGTMLRILPNGDELRFDIREAVHNLDRTKTFNQARVNGAVELICDPGARGATYSGTDKAETTLPVVIQTEAAAFVKGSIPARGKLVIDDDQGADRLMVIWGVQSRYYDASANADLFYQAESRTPLNGAATNAGPTGASGSSTIRSGVITPNAQSILSTQASGGGAQHQHIGLYRVIARCYDTDGTHAIALQWAQGDLRKFRSNEEKALPGGGAWYLVDLGVVRLEKAVVGAQRWEGRFNVRTTSGANSTNNFYVDWYALVPIGESWGKVEQAGYGSQSTVPTSPIVADEFDQATGVIDLPKAARVGGNYSQDNRTGPNGFQIAALHTAARAIADADLNSGARVYLGTPADAAVVTVQADVRMTAKGQPCRVGVTARYATATGNGIFAVIEPGYDGSGGVLAVYKRIGGTWTVLGRSGAARGLRPPSYEGEPFKVTGSPWYALSNFGYRLRLEVSANGTWRLYQQWCTISDPFTNTMTPVTGMLYVMSGYDDVLKTGGTIATGKVGFYGASTNTVTYHVDNLLAWVPTFDLAIASSQSMEVRHDRVHREDATGAYYNELTPEGDYLWLPPAGREDRKLRWIVIPSRGNFIEPDSAIDDTSAQMFVTPMYDDVPEPT